LSEQSRLPWLRPTSLLGRTRLSLLVSLVVVTCAAWALTLYQALNMRASMDGMSDMAMGDMSNADWSLVGAGVFVAVWTVMMAFRVPHQ
jgi:predicted metal-binding membrane protein